MTRYTFDVKLFATAYVDARSEQEARRLLDDWGGFDELGDVGNHVFIGSAYTDGEPDLIQEEEGICE